jgi:VIT1/CCC1 family predicted Fe2+/Mn2+ transporter
MRRRSSIAIEIGWLAGFVALFAVLLYGVTIFLVPHHFNAKIAIVLAAFVAAMVTTAARARFR